MDLFNAEAFKKLEELKPLYFNETDTIKKQELKNQIDKLIKQITNNDEHFDFEVYFSEVFHKKKGFDIVIANPPYIKEYTFRNAFDGLRESPYYQGKMDIWYLFACKGIDLLRKDSGVLTFIAQNNWVTSYGASKMRNKVIQDTKIIQMIDFGSYMIFESSDIQTMIMIFKSDTREDIYEFDYRKLEGNDLNFDDVLDLLNYYKNKKIIYLKPTVQRDKFVNKPLTFSNKIIDLVLEKISAQSNFKLTKNEVAQGIVAAPDKYFIVNDLSKFNYKEHYFIKPFYTSTNRYCVPKTKSYLIYISHKNFQGRKINDFPNIREHFKKYKNQLQKAKIKYGTPQKPYFYLHRERDENYFKKGPKIAGQTRSYVPCFLYTEDEYYGSRAMNFIKTDRINLKYLVTLLNSSLIFFWLKHKGKMLGNMLHIDKEPLLGLPLKNIPSVDQQPFIDLVDKILEITKDDDYLTNSTKQAKVKEYERQIDQMVYKLYGLTEEEIKIVENFGLKNN
jgi:adenine-specific DNA-methyltransferase